jgi:hypothetical protein
VQKFSGTYSETGKIQGRQRGQLRWCWIIERENQSIFRPLDLKYPSLRLLRRLKIPNFLPPSGRTSAACTLRRKPRATLWPGHRAAPGPADRCWRPCGRSGGSCHRGQRCTGHRSASCVRSLTRQCAGGRGAGVAAPRLGLRRPLTALRVEGGCSGRRRYRPGPKAVETHPQPWDGGPMLMGLVVAGLSRRFLWWNAC